ncbi:hypothetical protein [Bacillus mycoides]|uniref:hypothetical protein n=1 Tax=Bacillus mycoides TaxID=1405 RepID=UPI000278D45B|nr:hypothetical protein [Bacillus mycoides]EJQ61752.1 hypothetical protein IEY_04237 [Bacillus mycoides]EJQ64612.1 hypothetical protein IEW_01096 [Bacillus mycoides]EJV71480.1 hypothetical protein IEU_01097 [Bacillus mycoides]MDR4299644.1 hypothetical protein [Bacillus mycoides]
MKKQFYSNQLIRKVNALAKERDKVFIAKSGGKTNAKNIVTQMAGQSPIMKGLSSLVNLNGPEKAAEMYKEFFNSPYMFRGNF